MIRINKNLAIFLGLILLLGVSLFALLQKFLPFVLHATYYCQSFINSLSVPIPYLLGAIPFLVVSIVLLMAIFRLSTIYIKVHFLRKSLIRNVKSNTSFNMLSEKLQLREMTYLIESTKPFAFCLGIRHAKIYISTSLVKLLTLRELEAVLRHERYHLNSRDTLTMLVASIGESLFPFFPLISDFLRNFRIEKEIKADAETIHGLEDEKPLISVLKKLLATPRIATLTASSIADQDTLEPRIRALVKEDFHFKKFNLIHILISLCSVFVMGIIAFVPVQAVEVHHMGEDAMMVCSQGNECFTSCRQVYSTNKKNYSENMIYTPKQ